MAYSQRQTAQKAKRQLEDKLQELGRIKQKINSMDKKVLHKGLQRVNSVTMRNVEVKHTSEFMIKLSNEYFVEVKTHTALDYLTRRKKNYEEQLKKLNLKLQVMEQRAQTVNNNQNKEKQPQVEEKYAKSTLESIGQNQQGEQIFNIIEIQQEEKPKHQKQTKNIKGETEKSTIKQNQQIQSQHQEVSVKPIQPNPHSIDPKPHSIDPKPQPNSNFHFEKPAEKPLAQKTPQRKQSSDQQSDQGGDLLLDRGQYSSGQSSLDEISEEENQDEPIQQTKESKPAPVQLKKEKQKDLLKNKPAQVKPEPEPTKPKVQANQKPKPQSKTTKKQTAPVQQPAKPISRFKLERMKQKLQASLQ